MELSKADFNEICANVFEKIQPLVDQTLRKANMTRNSIDTVVLVGGSTRIPKVRQILTEMFGENKINKQTNPDQAIAAGAGILAGLKSGAPGIDEFQFKDVTTHNIGIALYNSYDDKDEFKVLIPKNTEMPYMTDVKVYSTTVDNQKDVRIQVYRGGEQGDDIKNCFLIEMYIVSIPQRSKGNIQLEVTYEIDEDSLLKVKTKTSEETDWKEIVVSLN